MPEDQAPQLPTLPPPPAPGLDPRTASPPAKRRPTRLVAGAIVVVIAVIAGAVAFSMLGSKEPRANAQPRALAFNSGESETYTMHMTMDGRMSAGELLGGEQQVLMDVTQVVTWEVKAVDEDGVATINVTVDEMRGTVNGLPIPSEAATTPPIEIQVAPDGRIVSAGGLSFLGSGQTGGASFPGMDQMTPLLPDGAVAPGDTWAKEFSQDVPFGEGKIEFTATSTFERYEDVNGIDAAVVTTEYTVPLDFSIDFDELLAAMGGAEGVTDLSEFGGVSLAYGGEGSFEQTAWIDPGAEEMLKTSSSGSFDMTMRFEGLDLFDGQTIAFAGEFTQELSRT
jgi:hypothetical protein